jgi:Spy/CpxP family protein refolding chaperone
MKGETMNKKLSLTLLALFAAVLLSAGAGYAQCPMANMAGSAGDKGGMPDMMKFTPEQGKQMMDLNLTLIKETDPLKTDLKIKGMELMALWNEDNPEAKKILAKVKEISEVKVRLEEKMINHKLAMLKILTPEQKKMMKGMKGGCGMMGGMGDCEMKGGCGMMGGMGGCKMGNQEGGGCSK